MGTLFNIGDKIIGDGLSYIFNKTIAGYSLQNLKFGYTESVVEVRRSSDNEKQDFTSQEITNGTLESWIHSVNELPANYGSGAAAAYSLRYVSDNYTGPVVNVRRSSDNTNRDFTPSEITDGTLLAWVGKNIFGSTNNFQSARWDVGGSTIITSGQSDPDGGSNAFRLEMPIGGGTFLEQDDVLERGKTYTLSVYAKANGNTNLTLYYISENVEDVKVLTNTWERYSFTFTYNSGTNNVGFGNGGSSVDCFLYKPQLEVSNEATEYQENTGSAGANGNVTTWYDQSGNNRNATNSTDTEQPKIVDAGVLVEENGKPAINFFDGAVDFLDLSAHSDMFNNVGYAHLFSVSRFDTSTSTQTLFFAATGDNQVNKARVVISALANNTVIAGGRRLDADSFDSASSVGTISDGEQYLQSSLISYASSDINQYINGLLDGQNLSFQTDGNTSATDSLNSFAEDITIGSLGSANQYDGAIQELIIYTTDQSANRTTIEANINKYYGIYTPTVDGFVSKWYDQSGNGYHATNSTDTEQPKIWDASTGLVTDNGFSCLKFDGTDDNLSATLPAITGNMLLAGTEGSDIFGVDISGGSYSLLANAANTDYPLNSVAQVIWDRTLTKEEKDFVKNRLDSKSYSEISFDGVTNFVRYWFGRNEITQFPLIDTSSGTIFNNAWRSCSSLTTFPLLDLSSGSDFSAAWRDCYSLTSFPKLNLSSGTTFGNTWLNCTSLQDFPANRFDSVTATDFTNAFANTNLSSQSIENIVVSVDTANQNNGTLTITGGGNATTETAKTAIINLASRSWAVTVPDGYVSPYLIDAYQGAEAAYSLRQLSLNTTNVVRVRKDVINSPEEDFTAEELTDGTLETFADGNDCFVSKWYDQSGNGNHATQTTATDQPKIWDASTGLVTENGRPAIDFDGTAINLTTSAISEITQPATHVEVLKYKAGETSEISFSSISESNGRNLSYKRNSNYAIFAGNLFESTTAVTNDQELNFTIFDGANSSMWKDNTLIIDNEDAGTETIEGITIGSDVDLSPDFFGKIQEYIVYPSDQSANRGNIENNINNYYNIYS